MAEGEKHYSAGNIWHIFGKTEDFLEGIWNLNFEIS